MDIQINHLTFSYNSLPVLRDITYRIPGGAFTAIVGANGSGKSTLLKTMDGILQPQAGTVWLDGRDSAHLSRNALARQLGYVAQQEGRQYPTTVFNAVLLGRKPHISWRPGKHDLEKTEEVLRQMELTELAERDVNQLSGGQRQRALIGRALAQEPQVLLLDEPTASLDLRHQLEVLELLQSITKKGITVITAIHDLNMAMRFCSDFIMLKEAQIFASGGRNILRQDIIEQLYNVHVQLAKVNGHLVVVPK